MTVDQLPGSADMASVRGRYLNLLARTLTRYGLEDQAYYSPVRTAHAPASVRPLLNAVESWLDRRSLAVARRRLPDMEARERGADWPASAETMVGMKRLANLRSCLDTAVADGVEGDVLEAGVWRGGASIYMRAVLVTLGEGHRHSWLADSFRGLPAPEPGRYPADKGHHFHLFDELAVSRAEVEANFLKYDLLDDHVHFLEGWFEDTLPTAPVQKLALLRLDGDLYSSIIQSLNAMYSKVEPGGFVVADDYYTIPSCRQAIDDFRRDHGIADPIRPIDESSGFWRHDSV